MDIIKVSSKSNPNSVAGAIAAMIKDDTSLEINTVGAGALNQAIKAIAISRGYLAPSGFDLAIAPSFFKTILDEEIKTGIKLAVKKKAV